jgi:hypothetical protein
MDGRAFLRKLPGNVRAQQPGMNMGMRTGTLRHCMGMGLVLAVTVAKAAAPVYQITTNLNLPLDGRGTYLGDGQGVSMNNKGQVLSNKVSNVSTKFIFGSTVTPFGNSIPHLFTVKMQEVAPAVTTSGVLKAYPRYMGNTNTVGARIFDDGSLLVGVAPQSGKRQQGEVVSTYTPYVLQAGVFTAVAAYGPQAVTSNRQGWMMVATNTGLSLGRLGQLQSYQFTQLSSAAVDVFNGAAISSDGRGVVSIGFRDPWDSACFVAYQGQLSTVSPPQPGWRIDCRSINASGDIAGVVRRSTSTGATEAAVFVWRSGQFQVQPFGSDFDPLAMKLMDSGVLVLDKGLIFLGNTNGTNLWKGGSQVIRANGELFELESLLKPALPADQHLQFMDINDLGQALVRVTGAIGSPQKVISPSGL